MSRSRKKHPITSIACHKASNLRKYKRRHSHKERAHERDLLAHAKLGDQEAAFNLEKTLERWNEWDCPRDGKQILDPIKYRKEIAK